MTKSINKLWVVFTFGMVCVFIAFAFSNAALTTSKKLKSDFKLLDSKNDTLNEKMESILDRLEDIERKANRIEVPAKSNRNGIGANLIRPQNQTGKKENIAGKKNANIEELNEQDPVVPPDQRKFTYLGKKDAFESFDEILETFHATLSDEDLAELERNVESSMVAQLDVAASDANFSDIEADAFRKMMIEEEGDLMREGEMELQLMEMLLKAVAKGEFELVPR